ncbi:uncharacterized protein [Littorina saxatilis]|uniref:uncharacterized protein n=1 Tax=Littorina saxatilis TaxID=31220 RepID=UPI0038B5065F|eukprot:GHVL01035806.1.p1 GENE.GHVL01035806.1~~GHVL01035806.1.p1  ORF type:complete len:620 (+),score=45.50 GHVL01035806.1:74-1933(+)
MSKPRDELSKKVVTPYVDTLDDVSKRRYLQKIAAVKNIDPYENEDWSDDAKTFPPLDKCDVFEYLVNRTSYYTRERFKAMKQLGAHNQLTSGWVKKMYTHRPHGCENTIITSQVCHSQSISDKPLNPWVIVEADGTVQTAHCDCMAGIGESCVHVAALLFAVDVAVRLRDSKTPTQTAAYWVNPSAKNVMYEEGWKIDFTSSATRKRRMEDDINGTPSQLRGPRKRVYTPAPTEEEKMQFFESIQFSVTGVKPVILSLVKEFQSDYVSGRNKYPKFLGDLFQEELSRKPYDFVLAKCKDMDLSVSQEEAILAERQTRAQAKCRLWHRLRAGRITASRAYQVCHTTTTKPSLSLLHSICGPDGKTQSAAMKWGQQKEATAVAQYRAQVSNDHEGFGVEPCGLFIRPMFPTLGASPDGMIVCRCHGRGCLEVKCPASKADLTIDEACQDKNFCLGKEENVIGLKRHHPYYMQVQTQMALSETNFCDFVVWTKKGLHVERVLFDADFWQDSVVKMTEFFSAVVLPELVAHFFSQPRPQVLLPSPTKAASQAHSTEGQLYCICKRTEDEDDMVACDNENCKLEWFHFFCVGIRSKPKGQWYCPECRQLPQFQRSGKTLPKKRN